MGFRETIEGGAMASYLRGSMNTLLKKLAKLENWPEKIGELEQHLVNLNECFFKVAGRGKTDDQAQEWMKQTRELFFDIEDWIDEKLGIPKQENDEQPRTNMAGPSEIEEEIEETNMQGVDPSEFEKTIEGFITLMEEACGRCTRYNLVDEVTTSGAAVARVAPRVVTIDSRLLLEERPYLTALERPVEVLKKHLTDDQQAVLKVVSIVGTGGLGKTTLAKKIHEELQLQGKFQCGAFVHVGCRYPSILTILVNMLQQITCKYQSGRLLDEQQVIAELWTLLSKKRYLVVLDCIWSIRTWRVICCALPDNNLGSRVLITTRMKDVAKSCSPRYTDVVHQMEALSDDDSKRLFDEGKTQVGDDVLKMCGGIPLAIAVAAGLSTGKYTKLEEPKTLGQGILSSLEQYYWLSPEMTKILHMSYADLSIPLRSCFLYLSVFPEKYTIRKDRLIRLWGAEGFIPIIDEECLWVTGEMFFNELISRRLIQPVFSFDDDQAVGCTVHSLILDFIRFMSREENFATRAAELNSGPFPCDTIRRFSLDSGNEDEADTLSTSSVHLSSVRSLTVFGDIEGMLNPSPPSVSEDDEEMHAPPAIRVSINVLLHFKLLRVLDLEDTRNLKNHHLEGIGGLVLLRYLGLAGTGINRLPEDIGKLEQLETLDLRRNIGLTTFPASIVKLEKLRHLLLQVHAKEIWEMPELEGASDTRVVSSSSLAKVVELLRKSKRLRMLGLTLTLRQLIPADTNLASFFDEVVKSKLQYLSLHYQYRGELELGLLVDSLERVTATPTRKFELRISGRYLKRGLPNMGSLASLTHLQIKLLEIKEDFHVLEGLTNLVLLNLTTIGRLRRLRFIIKKGIFPCLKVFSFKVQHGWMGLEFKEGAMPQLRRLARGFRVSEHQGEQEYPDIGIEHLTCLTRVHATLDCFHATVWEVEATEAAIRGKLSEIPAKPTLELSREYEVWMWEDEQRATLRTEDKYLN